MCLYPKLIRNRKYIANKKNGGIIPAVSDRRVLLIPAGCGKCMECMKQKAREWKVRLSEEIRERTDGIFVTLTFSNESIYNIINGLNTKGEEIKVKGKHIGKIKLEGYELDNEIAKRATRLFLERWRKKYGKSIRHWLVTELGHQGTENIHMHGLLFTDEIQDIENIWQYGFVWIGDEKKGGYVNERTINYIVKYIHKIDLDHKEYKPRVLTSPGIGAGYLKRWDSARNKFKEGKTEETYTTRQGARMALPKYLRNKIYSDEEREKLRIEKLDKQIRYINGVKIDVSKGEENYYKGLEEARKLNKTLGYGDDSINWERKRYEQDRRILLQKERLEKGKTKQDAACRGGAPAPPVVSEKETTNVTDDIISRHMERTKKNTDGIW